MLNSCVEKEKSNFFHLKKSDSISNYYYKIANDKKTNLKKREQAINIAYKRLLKLKKDTFLYKVLYKKAYIHYLNGEYDSLLYYSDILEKELEFNNTNPYKPKITSLKGFYYANIAYDTDSAFYYYNQSKNIYKKLSDTIQIAKTLLNISYIQLDNSDYFGSKESVTEAIELLRKKGNEQYLPSFYHVLATNNRKLLNYEDAFFYYRKAIEKAIIKDDELLFKNNLSAAYIDVNSYNKAIAILKEIVKDSTIRIEQPKIYARALDNLAYSQWLEDSRNVNNTFQEALNIRKTHKDKLGLLASYTHLGEFYMKKNKTQAINYFIKAINTSKSIKNPKGELDALQFLMKIKSNDLNIRDRYISLSDSLHKQELKVKTQFAKIRYDDKLKNEEIKELKTITKNQQLEVTVQQRQKIIYLLLGLIVIILAIFYSYYLIQKHKKDKEKEVYRTEKLISKRVHDEIANDISLLANLVGDNSSLQNPSSKKILESKLQNVYLRARDISTDISSIDLKDFKEELKNLIIQYNTGNVNVITNLEDFEWSKVADHKKIAIYRVLQELFINTKKHSNCKRITLMLKDKGVNRIITYTDDGVGFNKNKVKFNGLNNAENRIENISGSFNFETNPDKGVKVIINIKR